MTGYLPGDPRYGLSGEALRNYYRTKSAQWAIYCWDKPGTAETRRGLVQDQNSYVKNFGDRVIGYGHFVSDDGRDTLGSSFFMQLDDRSVADAFVAGEPMSKAGVYQRIEIHRWSNSFQKRAADYRRKGMQQFLCTGPKTGSPEFFREHLHAHESYFASYGDSFIFRGPIRSADGADNIGTALRSNCPTGLRRTGSGTRSRSPRTAGIGRTRGSRDGCLVTDWCMPRHGLANGGYRDSRAPLTTTPRLGSSGRQDYVLTQNFVRGGLRQG